jgi:hypothetical protein
MIRIKINKTIKTNNPSLKFSGIKPMMRFTVSTMKPSTEFRNSNIAVKKSRMRDPTSILFLPKRK